MSRLRVVVSCCALGALVLGACSSSGADKAADTTTTSSPRSTTSVERPAGPAATVEGQLTGGKGVFLGEGVAYEPDPGWVQEEYAVAGTATSYRVDGEQTADGRWTLEPASSADYRTRVVVRRPEDPAAFSGTVVVEWLNVSGGVDANPDFTTLREEIVRRGDIWVGVSAQVIGVEGGPVAVKVSVPGSEQAGLGLKGIDPQRYGSLSHPGDAYAYDIYTQVARALREGGPILGGATPDQLIAAGESQSAFAMVSYINGVQPLTHAFDGFFVHSRGGTSLPLDAGKGGADIAAALSTPATIIRTDTTVPVFELQTEADVFGVLGSYASRQPDSDTFRLWEVPGTAHADLHLIGESTAAQIDCGVQINDGPLHIVAKAAYADLAEWVAGGDPPPEVAPIDVDTSSGTPVAVRDATGVATGGVRTPPVDVPVRVLSGTPGPSSDVICILLGSTTPIPPEQLTAMYGSRDQYQQRFDESLDQAITEGYVLEADRAAMEGYAHPELVPA